MAVVKDQINEIEDNIQGYTKLRIIVNRYNTSITMKDYFREFVANPEKLPDADLLYILVPSLKEMTTAYRKMSEQPGKGSETYQTLQELAEKIELTCEKLEEDYLHFQEDRIQDSRKQRWTISRRF